MAYFVRCMSSQKSLSRCMCLMDRGHNVGPTQVNMVISFFRSDSSFRGNLKGSSKL